MTIKKLFTLIFGGFFILLVLLGILSVYLLMVQQDLNKRQEIRFRSYLLAYELRQSSDDLTRFARTYVATGDSKYENFYYDVLAIRNGEKPRPVNYQRAYWDFYAATGIKPRPDEKAESLENLMHDMGFTEEEFAKLEEAKNNSDKLVKTEEAAFQAMKGYFRDQTGKFVKLGYPDQQMAIRILHDDIYHQEKARIMKPLDDFFELLEVRTRDMVQENFRRSNYFIISITLILFLLISLTGLSYLYIRRRIAAPLKLLQQQTVSVEADLDRLANIARDVAKGELLASYFVNTQPLEFQTSDEIARFSRLYDNMIEHLQMTGEAIMTITADLSEKSFQLNKEKDFLQKVIDAAPGFIYVKDINWKILLANKSMADAFGAKSSEMYGKSALDYLPDTTEAEKRHNEYLKVIESGEPSFIPEELITYRNGSRHWHMMFIIPLTDEKGVIRRILGVTTGITALKEAEQEKNKLMEELQKSNKELNDFAYIVSHDLKAPLRAIGSLSDWIYQDYIDKLDEDGRQNLQLLKGRVKRMEGLIEAVLTYSRTTRLREEITAVNLKQVIEEVIDMLKPPQHIKFIFPDSMPGVAYEKTKIYQVFQNLIGNAVKYMDKAEGLIRITISEENNDWVIHISDNGPGIEQKYFEKIFQIFQTLKPRDELESTGIGLTIVKKIVEIHGGKIWLESESGKGTTFHFSIPQYYKH